MRERERVTSIRGLKGFRWRRQYSDGISFGCGNRVANLLQVLSMTIWRRIFNSGGG